MTSALSFSSGDVAALVSLLERQHHLYQQLSTLSQQQSQHVADAAAEALLGVIAQRQRIIDDLSRLNEDLSPYRQRWAVLSGGLSLSNRQRVSTLVRQAEELLGAIIKQDERDRQQLERAQTQIAGELQKTTRVGAAINAYRPAATDNNRFTNRQG